MSDSHLQPRLSLRYECPMVLIAQIALGVIIAVAQAAEPAGTLTLVCEGTVTSLPICSTVTVIFCSPDPPAL
jgi:hypothetical protein